MQHFAEILFFMQENRNQLYWAPFRDEPCPDLPTALTWNWTPFARSAFLALSSVNSCVNSCVTSEVTCTCNLFELNPNIRRVDSSSSEEWWSRSLSTVSCFGLFSFICGPCGPLPPMVTRPMLVGCVAERPEPPVELNFRKTTRSMGKEPQIIPRSHSRTVNKMILATVTGRGGSNRQFHL